MTKVLIIDDEPTTTDVLQEMLVGTQFEVVTANTGERGVQITQQQKPDIVVLDLVMPGMNGWEVCRAIRAFSQVPILILSAVTTSDGVLRILNEGADDYLVKPVPRNVLISHIRMLTRQAPATHIESH